MDVPISCNRDCGGGCPLLAVVDNGRVTRIVDNPLGGPYRSGCAKGFQVARVLYAPDRLKHPLIRTGPRGSGQFREVSWHEALDRVASQLADIAQRHGHAAVLHLGGSGSGRGALHNTDTLTRRFLSLWGGYTESYWNYSSAAAHFVTPFVLGTEMAGIDPGTLQFSQLIVLWGANIADTRLGCEMDARVREARERGVEVIVIDPRRTASVSRLGTQWIPVRPGTDTALMQAVLYVLLDAGLVKRGFVDRYSVGFDPLERHVLGLDGSEAKTPRWAESICGTPAGRIERFARQYGQAHPAALIPGLSIQRNVGGEEAIRMAIALQVATGNLGVPGGSSGALTWGRLPEVRMGQMDVAPNPCPASVPVCRWPDAVLEGQRGGYPSDVRAIYNVGGNFIGQGSDVRKSVRAFEQLEFAVCHDYFLTPTARYCDVVLPATTFLERDDIVFPHGGHYVLFSNQAVPPLPETKNDYTIFCELARRLGFLAAFSGGKSEEEWLRSFMAASDVPDYETFKRSGIYEGKDQLRVGLSDFVADPETHPLSTPSGLIELAPAAYAQMGYPAVPTFRGLPGDARYPLRLVTPHPRHRVHSQGDNVDWFRKLEPQSLWIHPQDAAQRNIDDGQAVLVSSPEGHTRVAARVTEAIMPGVVCLLQGAWPCLGPDGVDTAGSANVLTSSVPTQPSQGARTHSVLVEVAPA